MMPLATLFEEDMEIKIFVWNAFTKKLFMECTDRKFGVKREAPVQVPVEAPAVTHKKIGKDKEDPVVTSEKTCKQCEKTKPLDAFSKKDGGRLGRTHICKDCNHDNYLESTNDKIGRRYSSKKSKIKPDIELKLGQDPPKTGQTPGKMGQDPPKTGQTPGKMGQEPVDNHLSKKMMENSTGGDWDTAEIDILEANFFKLGGAELGALKIVEQNLLPGRTFQEINNMARYKGMMK